MGWTFHGLEQLFDIVVRQPGRQAQVQGLNYEWFTRRPLGSQETEAKEMVNRLFERAA